jgi:arylsulfatase A-like enzyme
MVRAITLCGILLLAVLISGLVSISPFKLPRLVILYATCSLNKDYLGPYNRHVEYTKNLDAFAQRSTVFLRHMTEVGCSGPAFATLFTGTHVYRTGIYYHPARIDDKNYMMAELYGDSGYDTFWWTGHSYISPEWNFGQGVPDSHTNFASPKDGKTLTSNDRTFASLLQRLKFDKNFKAYIRVSFSMTHAPYSENSSIPETLAFCRRFPEECKRVTPQDLHDLIPIYKANYVHLTNRFEETTRSLNLQPSQIQKLIDVAEVTYKSSVHRLDRAFGRTISAVQNAGLFEESLIVFTSDHGETIADDEGKPAWGHCSMNPEVLNVPLIVHGQRLRKNRYEEVSRSIDIFPTLASLTGIQIPSNRLLDGHDLSASRFGKRNPTPQIAYSCSTLYHPATGEDDPSELIVQARIQDRIYTLNPKDSRIEICDLAQDNCARRQFVEPQNLADPQIVKDLRTYRERLIRSYQRPPRTEDWIVIHERLRSLGYI